MRIRRNASRLLGCAVSSPPRFELPPPSGFELPPPANEIHAGFAYKTPSSSPEICTLSVSPWDLMDEFDFSDPKEEERFMETYSVPVVPASSINNDVEEDMSVDMVSRAILELHLAEENNAVRKKESKLKTKEGEAKGERYVAPEEEEEHESRRGKAVVKKSDAGGRARPVYLCNKIIGKGCFCRRRVRRPDSFCWYHSGQKPAASSSSKPRRKRAAAEADKGFYYYAGFGPSGSTTKHRSSVPEELPLAVLLPGEHIDIEVQLPEEHTGFTANHQMALACVDNEPECDDGDMALIAGCDEEITSHDVDTLGCNGELSRDVKRRKSPLKKRRRKAVKARSLNALM